MKKVLTEVQEHVKAGLKAADSMALIRNKAADAAIIKWDLWNQRAAIRKLELGGRLPIQAMMIDLAVDYYFFDKYDEDLRLTELAFFHKKSLELLSQFPEAVVIDGTYRTNWFELPMVNLVAPTSTNRTLYFGGAFMRETTESFTWLFTCLLEIYKPFTIDYPLTVVSDADQALLAASAVVLPFTSHNLCVWHIQRAVQEHFKKYIRDELLRTGITRSEAQARTDERWGPIEVAVNNVIYAPTIPEFEAAWDALKRLCSDLPVLITYFENQWMPHKEKIVKAWTDSYLYFDNTSTSRIEGYHRTIKEVLPNRQAHLRDVLIPLTRRLNERVHEITAEAEQLKILRRHDHAYFLFNDCHGTIAPYAFNLVQKHMRVFNLSETTAREPLRPCTGRFTSLMGLPCAHLVQQCLVASCSLSLMDFNAH
jgi:hypothetical protein